ncbi:MAG: porphobilinogen synthase, partial [Deltaproteobacteria bacterium]|nr:porphobilinogen synthase [Deltaproteobacteria bacterium]
MKFPDYRPRRLRKNAVIRRMMSETQLTVDDLVLPLFVTYGKGIKKPIESMPGHFQLSVDNLKAEIEEIVALGIPAVILFGIPEKKDASGLSAFASDGPVQEAIKVIKDAAPELYVITDVCMCEYTSHGHCGYIKKDEKTGEHIIDNDETLKLLSKEALSHAEAGVDIVAPSDMMDGRVGT